MAICTQCGRIIHDEDVDKHICNPSEIPTKGKEKKANYQDVI
jgi:hypothetical protein